MPRKVCRATNRRSRVAVVFGGRSTEHAISCVTAGSVLAALDRDAFEVVPVGITPKGAWVLATGDPAALRIHGRELPAVEAGAAVVLARRPDRRRAGRGRAGRRRRACCDGVDVVFPVLHGPYGEDGTIQGLLEMAGVPYVGSGVLASAAAMDKEFTKKLLRAEGLPVGPYAVVRPGEHAHASRTASGSGCRSSSSRPGAGRASASPGSPTGPRWTRRSPPPAQIDPKVLVEAAVPGREVECGVLEGETGGPPEASVPAEIRLVRGHDWYDFEAKYLDDACEFDVPAELPAASRPSCGRWRAARSPRWTAPGWPGSTSSSGPPASSTVNEVNTMPGFTPISMFPRMWAASGLDYPALLDRLIRTALARGTGLH